MSSDPSYPVICPSCGRPKGYPRRVSTLTSARKIVTIRCDGCESAWTIEVDIAGLPDAPKARGLRLDSQFLAIDALFGRIRAGWLHVESAQKLPAGEGYDRTIAAARNSVAAVLRMSRLATLTALEWERLEQAILVLKAAIDASYPRR